MPKEVVKHSPSAGAGASDSSTMASEDYNDWEDHLTRVRPLRQRSRSRLMPYTAEKFNHRRVLQRKLERDGYFDHNAPSRRFKQASHEYVSVKKRHTLKQILHRHPYTFPFKRCYAGESLQTDEAQHKTHHRLERRVRSGVSGGRPDG